MSAFEPFEDFGDVESIAEGLNDADAGTRRVTVMELADTAAPEAVPFLARAIKDQSDDVRLQAVGRSTLPVGEGSTRTQGCCPGGRSASPPPAGSRSRKEGRWPGRESR